MSRPIVHILYRDVTGEPATIDGLRDTISRYSLADWLHVLARLDVAAFKSPLIEFYSYETQKALLGEVFPPELAKKVDSRRLQLGPPDIPGVVFSDPQIHALRVLALRNADLEGGEGLVPGPIPEPAARAFLQANELFDWTSTRGVREGPLGPREEDLIGLIIRQHYLK